MVSGRPCCLCLTHPAQPCPPPPSGPGHTLLGLDVVLPGRRQHRLPRGARACPRSGEGGSQSPCPPGQAQHRRLRTHSPCDKDFAILELNYQSEIVYCLVVLQIVAAELREFKPSVQNSSAFSGSLKPKKKPQPCGVAKLGYLFLIKMSWLS